MEIAFIIHVIIFCLSDAYFCPLKTDKKYKKLFVRNFPFISLMSVLYFIFFLAYLFISELILPTNYIDSFYNRRTFLFMFLYTIIIFVITLFIVGNELYKSSPEAKNSKILLIPAIFIFMYTSSVIWSGLIIHFTNSVFDFSKGEKIECNIVSGQIYETKKDLKPDIYYVDIRPDICGLHRLDVSKTIFEKAKNFSKYVQTKERQYSENPIISFYDEPKLVLYVYKGLYGIRYVSKSMDVIKNHEKILNNSEHNLVFPYINKY